MDRRGPGGQGGDVARRLRRRPGPALGRGPRRLVAGWRRDRRPRPVGRHHDLHTGVELGRATRHRRVARPAGRPHRHRDRRRRDRGVRVRPARPGGHRGRSAVEPRAHPPREPHRPPLARRRAARPRHARGRRARTADAQARRVRDRPVLPGQGPHGARHEAQRAPRLALVRRLVAGPAHRPRRLAAHPRRPATVRDRHHRAPVRRRAPVRHVAPARQAGHVDAPPDRHHRPACAALHGRGRRLPATRGEPAHQEADHDPHEAGARLRCGGRARDPEPGRRRLQGHLQRGHLDDRPAADRSRQAAPARGHDRCGRWRRRGRDRRHHLRAGEARVPAAPRRHGPPRGVHHAVGHELPARPAHPRTRSPASPPRGPPPSRPPRRLGCSRQLLCGALPPRRPGRRCRRLHRRARPSPWPATSHR